MCCRSLNLPPNIRPRIGLYPVANLAQKRTPNILFFFAQPVVQDPPGIFFVCLIPRPQAPPCSLLFTPVLQVLFLRCYRCVSAMARIHYLFTKHESYCPRHHVFRDTEVSNHDKFQLFSRYSCRNLCFSTKHTISPCIEALFERRFKC